MPPKKKCFTRVRMTNTPMGPKGSVYQGCATPKAKPTRARREVTPQLADPTIDSPKKKKLILKKKKVVEKKAPKMPTKAATSTVPPKKTRLIITKRLPTKAPKLERVSLRLYGNGMPMNSGAERRGSDVFINRENAKVYSSQEQVKENKHNGVIVKIKMGRGKKAKEGIMIGNNIWEKDADYGYDYGDVMRSSKVDYRIVRL